jgi:hypothetical protein
MAPAKFITNGTLLENCATSSFHFAADGLKKYFVNCPLVLGNVKVCGA